MLNRRTSKIGLFLDSGAHSWYNANLRGLAKKDYAAVYDSETFWSYVDKYCTYLKDNKDLFDTYVNVDVIFDPRRTRRVQRYMEEEYGLSPMPVYHFGEDLIYLKMYMDNYEYIGIGGLGQEVPKTGFVRYADRIFRLLCDDKGRPLRKLHGFAMTSPELMLRYPWHSVDSTSWLVGEKFGLVIVPRLVFGQYDYSIPPVMVSMTTRKSKKKNHISNLSSLEKDFVLRYCKETLDVDYGKSEFITVKENYKLQKGEFWANKKELLIERVIEKGIGNDMQTRNALNIRYFQALEDFTKENPILFKPDWDTLT